MQANLNFTLEILTVNLKMYDAIKTFPKKKINLLPICEIYDKKMQHFIPSISDFY